MIHESKMIEVFLSPLLSENNKSHALDLIKQIYPNAIFAPKLTPEVTFRIVNPKDILYITKMNCLTITTLCIKHAIEKNIDLNNLQTDWRAYCNLFLYEKKVAFYKMEEKQIKRYSTMVKCMGGIILNTIESNDLNYVITKECDSEITLKLGVLPSWIDTLFYESQYVKPFHFFPRDQNSQENQKQTTSENNKLSKISSIRAHRNNLKTPVNVMKTIKGDNAGFILRKRDNTHDIRSFMNNPLRSINDNNNNLNTIVNGKPILDNENEKKNCCENGAIDNSNNDVTDANSSASNTNPSTNEISVNNITQINVITQNISINHIAINNDTPIKTNNKNLKLFKVNSPTLNSSSESTPNRISTNEQIELNEEEDDDVIILTKEDYLHNIEMSKRQESFMTLTKLNKVDKQGFDSNLFNINKDHENNSILSQDKPNNKMDNMNDALIIHKNTNERATNQVNSFERRPLSAKMDSNIISSQIGLLSKKPAQQNTNIFKRNDNNNKVFSFLSSSSSLDEDDLKLLEENINDYENAQENRLYNAIQGINSFSNSSDNNNNNNHMNVQRTNNSLQNNFDLDLAVFSQSSQSLQTPKPTIIGYDQPDDILITENFSSNDRFLSILSNF